jgi:quercetin dioxygenase-like cupin family protein
MRRSILAGSLLAAGLALSATAPVDATPTGTGPVGAKAVLIGNGYARSNLTLDVEDGKNVSTQTITVAPGGVIDWGADPVNVVALVQSGTLTSYPSCSGKEVWETGHAYPFASPGVVKNEGSGPAEVLAVVSNALSKAQVPHAGHDHGSSPLEPMEAMEAPVGCPTGTAAKGTDHGSGLSVGSTQFSQKEHKQIAIYQFTLQPGYSTDWHTHPGRNLIIQTKGKLDNWTSCKDKEVWDSGYAYFHAPGHPHQNMTNNTGKEPAELVGVFFDLPQDYPPEVPPVIKAPPPSDCPQHFMTST